MRWRLVYDHGNIPAHGSTGTFPLPFFRRHDFSQCHKTAWVLHTLPRINNNSRRRFINEEEGQTHKISCIINFKTHIRSQRILPRHIFMSRALPGAIPHIRYKSQHFLDYRIRPTTDHVLMLHTASIQKQTGLKIIHTSSSRVDWGDIHERAHSRRSFSAALLLKPHAQQQTSCGIPTRIICALAASVVLVINCAKSTTQSAHWMPRL